MLTAERTLSRRHRIARIAIIIYFVAFLAAGFAMCSCPGFFAVMAICALVSFIYGSRWQRFLSVGLLPIAIVGFYLQLQEEFRIAERAHRTRELQQKHLREQQVNERVAPK
ncbi:MAG: hypothetical protein P4L99_26570 [Chthoniobacter sp.]|nr:hypothetical protein [Chthoniobacter sp.]